MNYPLDGQSTSLLFLATQKAQSESEALSRNLSNTIDEGVCIIEVIFDAEESPVDYRFFEVNAAFEEQTGLHGVVGRRILEFTPDLETYWFDLYGSVALTGKPTYRAP